MMRRRLTLIYNFPCFRSLIFTSDLSSFFICSMFQINIRPPALSSSGSENLTLIMIFCTQNHFSLTVEFSHKSHLIHRYRHRLNLQMVFLLDALNQVKKKFICCSILFEKFFICKMYQIFFKCVKYMLGPYFMNSTKQLNSQDYFEPLLIKSNRHNFWCSSQFNNFSLLISFGPWTHIYLSIVFTRIFRIN